MWSSDRDDDQHCPSRPFSKYTKWEQLDYISYTLASLEKDLKNTIETQMERYANLQGKLTGVVGILKSLRKECEGKVMDALDYKTLRSQLKIVHQELCFYKAHLEHSFYLVDETISNTKTQLADVIHNMEQIEINFKREVVKLRTHDSGKPEEGQESERKLKSPQIQSGLKNNRSNSGSKIGLNVMKKNDSKCDMNISVRDLDMNADSSSCSGIVSVAFKNIPMSKGEKPKVLADTSAGRPLKATDHEHHCPPGSATPLAGTPKWEKLEYAEKILSADIAELRFTVMFLESSFDDMVNKMYNVRHMTWPFNRHQNLCTSDYTVLWRKMAFASRMLHIVEEHLRYTETLCNKLYNSFLSRMSLIINIVCSIAFVFKHEELEVLGLTSGSSECDLRTVSASAPVQSTVTSTSKNIIPKQRHQVMQHDLRLAIDSPSTSDRTPKVSLRICENICCSFSESYVHCGSCQTENCDVRRSNSASNVRDSDRVNQLSPGEVSSNDNGFFSRWNLKGEVEFGPKYGHDSDTQKRHQKYIVPSHDMEYLTNIRVSPPQLDPSCKRHHERKDHEGRSPPTHRRDSNHHFISEDRNLKPIDIEKDENMSAHHTANTGAKNLRQSIKVQMPKISGIPSEKEHGGLHGYVQASSHTNASDPSTSMPDNTHHCLVHRNISSSSHASSQDNRRHSVYDQSLHNTQENPLQSVHSPLERNSFISGVPFHDQVYDDTYTHENLINTPSLQPVSNVESRRGSSCSQELSSHTADHQSNDDYDGPYKSASKMSSSPSQGYFSHETGHPGIRASASHISSNSLTPEELSQSADTNISGWSPTDAPAPESLWHDFEELEPSRGSSWSEDTEQHRGSSGAEARQKERSSI